MRFSHGGRNFPSGRSIIRLFAKHKSFRTKTYNNPTHVQGKFYLCQSNTNSTTIKCSYNPNPTSIQLLFNNNPTLIRCQSSPDIMSIQCQSYKNLFVPTDFLTVAEIFLLAGASSDYLQTHVVSSKQAKATRHWCTFWHAPSSSSSCQVCKI